MHYPTRFLPRSSVERFTCAFIIGLALSACGGGGGGAQEGAAISPVTAAKTPDTTADVPSNPSQIIAAPDPSDPETINDSSAKLLISEIGPNYYVNDVAWFELYNPEDRAVSLSGYTLRSSHVDLSANTMSLAPMTFNLPTATIPAKGYLVIAGRVYDNLKNNRQIVYIANDRYVPFWTASGSLELVAGGKTIDFIRLGASTAAPLNASAWGGANVANLPSGVNEYGRAIVRLASGALADSDSARDWSLVNFATPAGMNDVEPGVIDSDRDGIPDSAKAQGGTYAGLDLYAMGARSGQRDLFVEIDYMSSTDPGITPRREALQKLVAAFAEKNVAVHIDTGNLHGSVFDPAQFNLGGGNSIDYAPCIELAADSEYTAPGCTSFYDFKSRHFDVRRKFLFHYAVFANSLNPGGGAGPSGMAEMYGNDLIVTLGNYGLNTSPGVGMNLLVNLQASTLMHELGHNLGLRHGGNEDLNYKPNHYSVMNYMYQFAGLSETPDSIFAAERYYLANNLKGKTYCNLVENSPCSSNFKISYSNGSSINLDESNLLESANIGRGSVPGAYADWNDDGVLSVATFPHNITPLNDSNMTILRDYDEWSNLVFAFSRHFAGAVTGNTFARRASPPRPNPMNQRPANKLPEVSLPVSLQDAICHSDRDCHAKENR